MPCIQCNKDSKYKCPTCLAPYCSVDCFKEHQQIPCTPPPEQPKEDSPEDPYAEYDYPTEDTLTPEKLKLLDQSPDVRKCLENPHVCNMLELLDKSPYPDALMQEYMQEPIFTEFVDACLSAVQPAKENKKE